MFRLKLNRKIYQKSFQNNKCFRSRDRSRSSRKKRSRSRDGSSSSRRHRRRSRSRKRSRERKSRRSSRSRSRSKKSKSKKSRRWKMEKKCRKWFLSKKTSEYCFFCFLSVLEHLIQNCTAIAKSNFLKLFRFKKQVLWRACQQQWSTSAPAIQSWALRETPSRALFFLRKLASGTSRIKLEH